MPIPDLSAGLRADLANRALQLQERWTHRRDLLQDASDRLSVLARSRYPARWLWPDLPDLSNLAEQAPKGLRLATERRKWAEAQLNELEAARAEALQAAIDRGGQRQVRFERGELRLFMGGTIALGKIYLDAAAGQLAEAYWRLLLLSVSKRGVERFAQDLRRPPAITDAPAAAQFVDCVALLSEEVSAIECDERELNELAYSLYALSADERNLVENERF